MLKDPELFDLVEKKLREEGLVHKFEEENGPVRGRMMITFGQVPEDLDVNTDDPSVYVFECSFDFYDTTLGVAINTNTLEAVSGLWCTVQKDRAEKPDDEWISFFIKTLYSHISKDGSFGMPIYSLLGDVGDITIVPVLED